MHHGGGYHGNHRHMHHEHDEHEIAADHGHEHMPNLFPIGIYHPGMHGGMHDGMLIFDVSFMLKSNFLFRAPTFQDTVFLIRSVLNKFFEIYERIFKQIFLY